jgi:hypothetical protein
LLARLRAGDASLRRFLGRPDVRLLQAPDAAALRSVDTWAEYTGAHAELAAAGSIEGPVRGRSMRR